MTSPLTELPRLVLPQAPAKETAIVKAWEEPVTMTTYLPAQPDPNPLFLEKRVYQGSSGKVYPLPVIDRIATLPSDHAWQAVHLENEYLRVMILPEIGGRIHVGYDKRNGYDFFYRQNVIKPALVGLAGPWISGGVEFNWPQHHRPATFLPVEVAVERHDDGSVTVWCSDHDPLSRMKGMHGVCLHPGCAYIELKVRLYNRTYDTQTFLWWANAAARVHQHYQSFFPGDVRFVADHAKRAITEFPQSLGTYYGIDYGKRALEGVPAEDQPSSFLPDGSYPPNDLSWYANIPVPTSYMIVNSSGDFFGGYDHAAQAGFVHFADHHIAPGKKQWTWGNHEFGYAWDRSLTESDGPYIELMAGVYTDNQPDFSYLAPGETKTFSQFWYPIQSIGVPSIANLHAAMRVTVEDGSMQIHLAATRTLPDARLRLFASENQIALWSGALQPESPEIIRLPFPNLTRDWRLELESGSETLLSYAPSQIPPAPAPVEATEPLPPDQVSSTDELYLIGLHLEQYRHATRSPELYWREALRRDPLDSRINNALGRFHLRRGEFTRAAEHLLAAVARLTQRNPNPYDCEAFYNLGLVRLFQNQIDAAYAAFYKASWSAAWRGPAYHRLAEIDCRRARFAAALDHIERSLSAESDNLNGRNLQVVLLRRLGRHEEADAILECNRKLDPLDLWSRFLQTGFIPADSAKRTDLSFDLMRVGLLEDANRILVSGVTAMELYIQAFVLHQLGQTESALHCLQRASSAATTCVFPSLLEEATVLEWAMQANPNDGHAPYYLGNLLYDRQRHREAIELWQSAAQLDPNLPTVWRNLGIAFYNIEQDGPKARHAFAMARKADPDDARILYEEDQLRKRLGDDPTERLKTLETQKNLVARRDDLSLELAALYNQVGRPADALSLLLSRQFQPWEGGEGLVLQEYVRAQLLLGRVALAEGDPSRALACFEAADHPPLSLSEARHLLANNSNIEFWLGEAWAAMGNHPKAAHHWRRATRLRGDFQQMQLRPVSEMTYWSALALRRLEQEHESLALFEQILAYATALEQTMPQIDYFATSLPTMLLFDEDLQKRQHITATFLRAQALLGLGRQRDAQLALSEVEQLDRAHAAAADLRLNPSLQQIGV